MVCPLSGKNLTSSSMKRRRTTQFPRNRQIGDNQLLTTTRKTRNRTSNSRDKKCSHAIKKASVKTVDQRKMSQTKVTWKTSQLSKVKGKSWKIKSPANMKTNLNVPKKCQRKSQENPKSLSNSKTHTQSKRNESKSSETLGRSKIASCFKPKKGLQSKSRKKGKAGSCRKPSIENNKVIIKRKTKASGKKIFDFSNLFLKNPEITAHIDVGITSRIYGICVTSDNLLWVIYLRKHVKLFDAAGKVVRSVKVQRSPVYNCCTPTGDLLFTQASADDACAEVTIVPRAGKPRTLVDLSSYASHLCGILCQGEMIYIVAYRDSSSKYFIIKLRMNGKVITTYEAKPENVNIGGIISHYGKIYAIGINYFNMYPLKKDNVSSVAMNKVKLDDTIVRSTCVDNLGNVLLPSDLEVNIICPFLQRLHKIRIDISDSIRSVAVDQQNNLWIGTRDGHLYIAKYLKQFS